MPAAVKPADDAAVAPSTAIDADDPLTSDLDHMIGSILSDDAAAMAGDDEELRIAAAGDDDGTDGDDGTDEEIPPDGAAAPAAEPAAAEPAAAATAPATPDAAEGKGAADPSTAWGPLSIKAGKIESDDPEVVPIPEASISRINGNVLIGMSEKAYERFQQRLSRGIVGERMWKKLDSGIKELEARKTQPARKSDVEIQNEITYEFLKPFIPEFLDAQQLEVLDLKVKLAQREESDRFAREEGERVTAASQPSWEETQITGLAKTTAGVWNTFKADFPTLTENDVRDVLTNELLPIKDSVFFRSPDGKQVNANTQYIFDRLKARAAMPKSATASPAASVPRVGAAPAATSPVTASPPGQTPASRADRLNRGADAAATTTDVKANRGRRPAQASTRPGPRTPTATPTERDVREAAVDDWHKRQRAYLNSNSFDVADDEADA